MIDNALLAKLKTKAHLLEYLEQSKNDEPLYKDVLDKYYYERLLLQLQAELVDFQKWVQKEDKKIAIIFEGQDLWEDYSYYKNQMFARTHNSFCPWIIVKSDNKRLARVESIKFVLSQFDYHGKGSNCPDLLPDPNIVHRFFRQQIKI